MMSSKCKAFLLVFSIGMSSLIGPLCGKTFADETYPTKPINFVIRSAAGGTADVMGRLLCKAAEKELGQPIVIENVSGASGAIGVTKVLKAKPDGYTIGSTGTNSFINSPHMEKLPYDVRTDAINIAVFYKLDNALCVRTDSQWRTYDDVLNYARRYPGKFTYAVAGAANTQAICMERIAKKEGIKWSLVPFKSGSESTLACLGGHTNGLASSGGPDIYQHVKAGKLRVLLTLNDTRQDIAPDVPTALEKYGFYGMSFQAVYGPKGIPESVRNKLQDAFKKAVHNPSYYEAAKAAYTTVVYMDGKEYDNLWKAQYDEMGKVIREMGLGIK